MNIDLRDAQSFLPTRICKFVEFEYERAQFVHPNVQFISQDELKSLKKLISSLLHSKCKPEFPTWYIQNAYLAGGCFTKQKDNCFKDVQAVDVFIRCHDLP